MAVSHANKVGKATGGKTENSNLIVAASAYILRKQGHLKADLKAIIGTLDKGSAGVPVKFKSVVKTAQSIQETLKIKVVEGVPRKEAENVGRHIR